MSIFERAIFEMRCRAGQGRAGLSLGTKRDLMSLVCIGLWTMSEVIDGIPTDIAAKVMLVRPLS